MIYLLGGPPRVGKSIISRIITREHGINVISTDSLGAVLEDVLDPKLEPGLFVVNGLNDMTVDDQIRLMAKNTAERIRYQREENHAVWKGVLPFIGNEEEQGRDIVIEGVAVVPELVRELKGLPYRALFVGHQGSSHAENICKSAEQNGSDWMQDTSDEYRKAFSIFVVAMSHYIEQEAQKYGYQYFEMSTLPFSKAIEGVVQELLGDAASGKCGR